MDNLPPITFTAVLEILIMAALIYGGYRLLSRTRGSRAIFGVAAIYLILVFGAVWARMEVLSFILQNLAFFLAIALVVIFQTELRQIFTDIANFDFFVTSDQRQETIDKIAEALEELSDRRFGALIAIQRRMDLSRIIDTGVRMDAEFSQELALTLFHPRTALHDGGLVMRNDRVVAAACIFPVTGREFTDRSIGLRHRAAIGLSEEFDSVVLVVSEETGKLSICHAGIFERGLEPEDFRERLSQLLIGGGQSDEADDIQDYTAGLESQTHFPAHRSRAVDDA